MSYKKTMSKTDKKNHKLFRDSRKKGSRGKIWQVIDKQD